MRKLLAKLQYRHVQCLILKSDLDDLFTSYLIHGKLMRSRIYFKVAKCANEAEESTRVCCEKQCTRRSYRIV